MTAAMLLESWDVWGECAARHLTLINARNKKTATKKRERGMHNIQKKSKTFHLSLVQVHWASLMNEKSSTDIPLPNPVCDWPGSYKYQCTLKGLEMVEAHLFFCLRKGWKDKKAS